MRYPTNNNRITSQFGYRYRTKNGKKVLDFHSGTDYGAINPGVPMDPIFSIADDSLVVFVGYDKWRGNNIILEHKTHCTRYNHLKDTLVRKGQIVNEDTVIGLMGSTGDSTGAHLHFEVHECNYPEFDERWSNGEPRHAIDPELFFLKYMNTKNQLIIDIEEVLDEYR